MGIFDAPQYAVTAFSRNPLRCKTSPATSPTPRPRLTRETDTSFEDLLSAEVQPARKLRERIRIVEFHDRVQGDIQSTSSPPTWRSMATASSWCRNRRASQQQPADLQRRELLYPRRRFPVQNGLSVNGAAITHGMPINPTTETTVGSVPTMLQLQTQFLRAQATTTINYGANLPTDPTTTNTSNLLNPDDFISNPLAVPTQPATMTGTGATLTPDADATLTGTADTNRIYGDRGRKPLINGTTIALTRLNTEPDRHRDHIEQRRRLRTVDRPPAPGAHQRRCHHGD